MLSSITPVFLIKKVGYLYTGHFLSFLTYPSKHSPFPHGFPAQSSMFISHNSPSYPGRHSHKPSIHVPWSQTILAHGSALGIFHSALRPARPAVPSDWKFILNSPIRVHPTWVHPTGYQRVLEFSKIHVKRTFPVKVKVPAIKVGLFVPQNFLFWYRSPPFIRFQEGTFSYISTSWCLSRGLEFQ